ncbi:sugar ABC transporter substrate-binding protein [Microbacterium invictum]|uniref:Ribose transport system substrate-binding protein n=1 Tax=Microbacterium invictum TaxID=515415 RepID=A0AA40SRW4_9MICO|nr:sugar ABC transporter substrate-binding protein [Microbacterium invictum]MBB4141277.1 ribose transport system substrate-binding protein [Microbacterium invictum]
MTLVSNRPVTTMAISVAATASLLLLTACASDAGGDDTPPGSTEVITLDVGEGGTIDLPLDEVKIGIFLQGSATAFNQAIVRGAEEEAAKHGYVVEAIDAQFDLNKQLNQIQTAATNKTYDVMAVEPLVAASECAAMTKTIPDAGLLSITIGTPCDTSVLPAGDDLWVPGTFTTIAGDTTSDYTTAFLEAAIELNPGQQKIALITGPELDPLVINQKAAIAELAETNSEVTITPVFTDWTTPSGLSKTRDYLLANPDVTVVLSAFSPDLSRGVASAMEEAGVMGTVQFADQGGTDFSVEQIVAGNMQFTLPYFPDQYGVKLIQAIHDAQTGKDVPRFISNIPAEYGTTTDPVVITPENVADFTPRY